MYTNDNIKFIKTSKHMAELLNMKIWIPYLISERGKVPSIDGHNFAKWKQDPDLLSTYRPALSLQQRKPGLVGVGFVVPPGVYPQGHVSPLIEIPGAATGPEHIVVLDLDHCFNDNGTLNDITRDFIDHIGSYTERSPGRGIHIIVKAGLLLNKKLATRINGQSLEIITPGNFITYTGNVIRDLPIANRTDVINEYYSEKPAVKHNHKISEFVPSVPANTEPNFKYGAAALDRECQLVRSQTKGTRTNTLRDAANKIGSLIGHIESEPDAIKALERAGCSVDLPLKVCEYTVRRGMEYGKSHPRANVPAPKKYEKLILLPDHRKRN